VAPAPPDAKRLARRDANFPGFDDSLRTAMTQETQLFFKPSSRRIAASSIFLVPTTLLSTSVSPSTTALTGIKGDDFQRVTFSPDDHRGGLLTEASILTITSYPNRTSPVQRGKWVLGKSARRRPAAAAAKRARARRRMRRR
jgi:hypothetical protein